VPALKNQQPIVSQLTGSTTAQIQIPSPQVDLTNQTVSDHQNAQSGTLYFVTEQPNQNGLTEQHQLSPMLHTNVQIKVTGIVARTTLTQTFKNASEQWVNGLYVFPLPENAAVDHLLMKVGERKIEGQIKEKAEAKKIYQQAKAAGKKASLVSQQRPNMFSNTIANIGPNETIVISIEYQQRLDFNQGQYGLRFPMSINPRYSPESANEEDIHTPQPSYQTIKHLHNIDLSINLHAGFDVEHIHSEFHPVTTKQLSDGSFQIQLAEQTIANQDFVLNWQPELGANAQSAHFSQQVNGDEYGLIMLLPPKTNQAYTPPLREVIFVMDTSGSMQGESLEQAKQALLLAITQLQPSDTFNIVEFNSYAQNLWSSPKIADLTNKHDAQNLVNSLSANGGTEMASAFKLAFAQAKTSNTSVLSQIIFITDGSVSNERSLMQLINKNIQNSRLFTVGIGSAPNSYFMTEAAKMGRGTFTYIGAVAQVQEKMQTLLTKLQHPAITDISLQLHSNAIQSNQQLEFYPNVISDVYLGEPMVLSYRLSSGQIDTLGSKVSSSDYLSKVKLSALQQNKPWHNPLTLNATTRQSGLNVLWAREKIAQLTRDKRKASQHGNHSAAEQDQYKSQITETALAHHLVSQYTSLIAVDITPTRPIEHLTSDNKVPNNLPKGTSNSSSNIQGKLPQTATPAQIKIIFGSFLIGLALCMHLLTKKEAKLLSY
jgi:Ca-activated chloride channel family protein